MKIFKKAKTFYDDAAEKRKQAKKAQKKYEELIKPVMCEVRRWTQLTKQTFYENPEELAKWGIRVDDRARPPKTKPEAE